MAAQVIKPMRGVAPVKPLTEWPYYASPKIDGARAIVKDGVVYSKTMKRIPSPDVQALFSSLHGFDGELTVGPPHSIEGDPPGGVYERSGGAIRRIREQPEINFQFHVFDFWNTPDKEFFNRLGDLMDLRLGGFTQPDLIRPASAFHRQATLVSHYRVDNQEQLDALEVKVLEAGYEGLILRHPDGRYKYGQSTENEAYLLKIKRFVDGEGQIIGFKEQMENTNEATVNELGRSQRSSAKEGKVGKDTLGAFIIRMVDTGEELSVGTGKGLDDRKRKLFWRARPILLGKYLRIKSQSVGAKDAPRIPLYNGFRDPIDMSDLEDAK